MTEDDATLPYPSIVRAVQAEMNQLARRHGLGHWVLTRVTDGASVPVIASDLCCRSQGTDTAHAMGRLEAEVLTTARSLALPDIIASHGALPACPVRPRLARAYLGVPLRAHDGTLTGVLSGIALDRPHPDLAAELPAVEATARLLSTLLEAETAMAGEAHRAAAAEWEAHSDHSTGLPNVRGWELMLDQEERRILQLGHSASVVYVDVDGLKELNEERGHAHGDIVLWRTANALRGAVRERDFVARVGDDEFGVLLPDCDEVGARCALARIRAALELADVTVSIGVASRASGGTLRDAAVAADAAVYAVKGARRKAHFSVGRR